MLIDYSRPVFYRVSLAAHKLQIGFHQAIENHLPPAGRIMPDADIFHMENSLSISVLILQKLLTFIKAYNRENFIKRIVADISL